MRIAMPPFILIAT